jgi:hypothetical protein
MDLHGVWHATSITPKWALVVALLIFGSVQNCHCTTVLVLDTKDYTLIAVDSLVSDLDAQTGKADLKRTCKLVQSGRIFIVAAGYFGEGGQNGFNAYALMQTLVEPEKATSEIADQFEKLAIKPYTKMLRNVYRDDPTHFKADCVGKECLQVIAATATAKGAEYTVTRFHIEIRSRKPTISNVTTSKCPGDCSIQGYKILGKGIEAKRVLDENPHIWRDLGILQTIDKLFQIEIAAHPAEVGGPISVLKLDNSGMAWLPGYQGMCPDVKSAQNPDGGHSNTPIHR